MRIFSYIVILILILLGVTFALLNAGPVTLNYYFGKQSIFLPLLLLLSLALGIIIGMLACFKPWFTLKHENRALRARIRDAEKEIANLRTIPMRDNQ